ncbi:MAG: sulfite exporter TauE/SafE family protein [Bacteroidales bacterium]|nr:sulfite exporter TauE/SafE family protein [Bacteroidales bacterium]MBP5723443.1 sulfite exporter TauE/SafE family protein [Bacteroidales bacterium]MBQ3677626.1 sulfite exporter TauE/SafE family protein [Bacteroidales bacterium]MBR4688866.1 sulfite exporter TauE/SafE family protein [Bacteroidales bacterium]
MAEKKEHKIIQSEAAKTASGKGVAAQQIAQSTVGLRIGAVVGWILALVAEFLAIKASFIPSPAEDEEAVLFMGMAPFTALIVFLVIDLICVIVGSLLWKKANHIHPASEKNALTFWLWNNLGVIMAAIAFIPFIILLLTNKNADQKTKTVGTIVAVVAMLIAGFSSYDYNPYSAEEQQEILNMEEATATVFWTEGGKVFHIYEDCQHLNKSEELHQTTTQEAEQAGKERLCKTCLKRHEKEAAETPAIEEQSALESSAEAPAEVEEQEVEETVEE